MTAQKVVSIAGGPSPTPRDVLEAAAQDLGAENGHGVQLGLVIARHSPGETDTSVYFSGSVRDLCQALGLLELGKSEMMRLSANG